MYREHAANSLAGVSGAGAMVSITAALPIVQLIAALVAIVTGILAARFYIIKAEQK